MYKHLGIPSGGVGVLLQRVVSFFLKLFLLSTFSCHFYSVSSYAGSQNITFQLNEESHQIHSFEKENNVWIDLGGIANTLGYKTSMKKDIYSIHFSTYTLALDLNKKTYSTLKNKSRVWKTHDLLDEVFYRGTRPMVPLTALPKYLGQHFAYHRQKRILKPIETISSNERVKQRSISVKYEKQKGKNWISLEDVAKAMGIIVYTVQGPSYKLVMPDFQIYELKVGDNWIYKRNERDKRLEEPIILLKGSPYATIQSLSLIFGAEVEWDRKTKKLRVPYQTGRLKDIKKFEHKPFTFLGYEPEPFNIQVNRMSFYYQNPSPAFSSSHDEPYESARDFSSNLPISSQDRHAGDRISGDMFLTLTGSAAGAPLRGEAEFEKLGTTARHIGGQIQWGFPKLNIKAAREYIQFGGLTQQFDQMDSLTLSHSNNHYGEETLPFEKNVSLFYGHQAFFVYMSTDIFSQTVEYKQKVFSAGGDLTWDTIDGQIYASVNQYLFKNSIEGVSSNRYSDSFFDLFADNNELSTVPASDEKSLAAEALTSHHHTTLLDLEYIRDNLYRLTGTVGLSAYNKPMDQSLAWDQDWKLKAKLGEKRSRIELSYENVGENYRSFGNPRRYQDRNITRLSPFVDLSKRWKIYGEFRRENIGVLRKDAGNPYRNDYYSLGQLLSHRKGALRGYVTKYESTLFGKRLSANVDASIYKGRDTFGLGGGRVSQWTAQGLLFRKSKTGRVSYQWLRKTWRLSAAEEITRSEYDFYNMKHWESATNVRFQRGQNEIEVTYDFKPRYFRFLEKIYTGYLKYSREKDAHKKISGFFSLSSLNQNLQSPEVWRLGTELTKSF